jgi:hypothetical protein
MQSLMGFRAAMLVGSRGYARPSRTLVGRALLAFALSLAFAAGGCGGSSSASTPPTEGGGVTFTAVYADILSTSCLPCHAPGGVGASAGRLNMSTSAMAYADLAKDASGASCSTGGKLVVPGDASSSLLVVKVASAHPSCGVQMPFGCAGTSTCLSKAQVQEIEDWINDGAHND